MEVESRFCVSTRRDAALARESTTMITCSSFRTLAPLWLLLLASCGRHELAPPTPPAMPPPEAVPSAPDVKRVVQIASGFGATCAVTDAGRVWCWGWLVQGASGVPVEIVGLHDVVEVALGSSFRCARHRDATVSCSGRGLGAGAAPNALQREGRIADLEGVTAIAAGSEHACALAHGRVHCWGSQPGRRTWPTTEVRREALPGSATQIAVGGDHSCALVNGEAWCWGPWSPMPRRVGVGGLVDVAVSMTGDICAVNEVGGLQCFGPRCGHHGTGWDDSCDHQIDTGATRVVASGPTCVEVKGRWQCFGSNRGGAVDSADDAPPDVSEPMPLLHAEELGKVAQVAPGYNHICAANEAGELFCWGHDGNGELGRGPAPWVHRRYAFGPRVLAGQTVGLGDAILCKTGDPAPHCWSGDVTLGAKFGDTRPEGLLIPAAAGCSLLAVRRGDACAARPGAVVCWGNAHAEPRTLALDGVSALVMGEAFGCALAGPSASLACWGSTLHLSPADPNNTSELRHVVGATGVTRVAAGGHHVCWSGADDVLWCVGDHANGLGEESSVPRRVGQVAGLEQIVGGRGFACVLARGNVQCVGDGSYGALGTGSWHASPTLQRVDLPPALALAAGNDHVCAVVEGGHVECWGDNGGGELGTATRQSTNLPTRVLGIDGADGVVAAAGISCARRGERLECWGRAASHLFDAAPTYYRGDPGPVLAFGAKPTVHIERVDAAAGPR